MFSFSSKYIIKLIFYLRTKKEKSFKILKNAIYALNKRDIDNKLKLESSIVYSQLYKNLLVEQAVGMQEIIGSLGLQRIVEQSARMQKILKCK